MNGTGLYRILRRRADQAGYDPKLVHPHMFRHILSALFPCSDSRHGEQADLRPALFDYLLAADCRRTT
jgi:hypothetical protein